MTCLLLEDERQARDHEDDAIARRGEPLVHHAEQVAKVQPRFRGRMHAFADFVGDEGHRARASRHDLGELVDGGEDRGVRVAAQHAIRDPDGDAVDDDRVDARPRKLAHARRHLERLFDGGPLRRTLGAMARDARRHVTVARLRGGDERDVGLRRVRGDRVAALAAARPAENEQRRHPRVLPRRPVGPRCAPGRSPGSRIVLLPAPSRPRERGQWLSRVSSPITVTGSRRFRTAFPGTLTRTTRDASMRAVARGMRTFLVAPVVLAATVVTAAAQPDTTLPPLRVIAPSRLPGDPLPAGSVPAAIDVIPGDALRGTGTTTLPRALEHLPGVAVGDEQGNTHQLSLGLRGFQVSPGTGVPQGVSVVVDGVRVNEPTVEEVNFDLLPLDEVERIEVIRGPSALFGRNTLGGAINIITRRGGTARALVPEMEAGSFGYQKYRLRFGGVEGPIDYYVGGSFSREDGWRERSASHLGKMFAKVGLQQGGTDLSLSYPRADNRIEQPGSLPESVLRQDRRANFTGGDFYKPLFNQATVALRQELGERFELAITAFGRALSVEQFNANVLDDNQRAFFDTTSLGATAQLTHQAEILERRNRLVLGFDHAHSDITVKVFEEQALRVRIDSRVHDHSDAFGFFAEDTLDLLRGIVGDADTLVLTAGARYDSIRHDIRDDLVRPGRRPSASQDSVFERGNPHVGLNYNATPALGFFAAYGESFRAPAFLELTCATPAGARPGPR